MAILTITNNYYTIITTLLKDKGFSYISIDSLSELQLNELFDLYILQFINYDNNNDYYKIHLGIYCLINNNKYQAQNIFNYLYPTIEVSLLLGLNYLSEKNHLINAAKEGSLKAIMVLAKRYQHIKDYDNYVKILSIGVRKNYLKPMIELGNYYKNIEKDEEKMLMYLNRAIDEHNCNTSKIILGNYYYEKNEFDLAVYYLTSIEENGKVYYLLSNIYKQMKSTLNIKYLKKACHYDNIQAMNEYSLFLIKNRKYKLAVNYLNYVLDNSNKQNELLDAKLMMGFICFRRNEKNKIKEYIKEEMMEMFESFKENLLIIC